MSLFADAVAWTCAGFACISILYWTVTARWLAGRNRRTAVAAHEQLAPVTFLRPLKPGVINLANALVSFLGELRPGDQVIFGVEADSVEERICRELRTPSGVDVAVIPCVPGAALNPKISKLVQMAPHASHERWIALDAEIVLEPGWLDRFRSEWSEGTADALTAGYRFADAKSFIQRLDVLPVLATLWPGLALMERRGSLPFMLGAVIAVTRGGVEKIGGWTVLSDYLADDNHLGSLLASAGFRVGLSREVATLRADPMPWPEYWRHQRRVAVTYRACDPVGFAGLICVHGVTLALVAFCIRPGVPVIAAVLSATLIARVLTLNQIGRALGVRSRAAVSVVVVSSVVETVCWLLAWVRPVVTWAGCTYSVKAGGVLSPRA
jgi:ceramide glucosyltransferase